MDEFEQILMQNLAARGELPMGQQSHALVGQVGGGVGTDLTRATPAYLTMEPGVSKAAGFDATLVPGAPRSPAPAAPAPAPAPAWKPPQYITGGGGSVRQNYIPPHLMTAWQQARARQRKAVSDAAVAQEEAGYYEASQRRAMSADVKEHQDRHAKIRAKLSEQLEPEERKLVDLVEAQAKKRVDPGRWWSDRTAGEKFGAVLANLLGGLAEGISGGKVRNVAAKMIMSQIDRDISAQKANIVAGERAISAQQGIVNAVYRRIGDADRAEGIARVGMITMAQQELAAVQAEQRGTLAAANAKVTQAGLEVAKTQALMQLGVITKTRSWTRRPADPNADVKREYIKAQTAALRAKGGKMGMGSIAQQKDAIKSRQAFSSFIGWMPRYEKAKSASATRNWPKDVSSAAKHWTQIGESAAIFNEGDKFAMALVKQMTGVQNRKEEQAVMKRTLPRPADSPAQVKAKVRSLIEAYGRNQLAAAQVAMELGQGGLARVHMKNVAMANKVAKQNNVPPITSLPGGRDMWLAAPITSSQMSHAPQQQQGMSPIGSVQREKAGNFVTNLATGLATGVFR